MDNFNSGNENNHHLTEPILDASYLDDELGLMLTGDLHNQEKTGEGGGKKKSGWGPNNHLNLTNPTPTSNNNSSSSHSQEQELSLSSITGSILDHLDFGSSLFNSSFNNTSTPSPTNTHPHPHTNTPHSDFLTFSTDSLDKSLFHLKKPNYTLAFTPESSLLNSTTTKKSDALNNNTTLPDLAFLKPSLFVDKDQPKSSPQIPDKKLNTIQDWPSLRVLLPVNYEKLLAGVKPSYLREKECDEEKERDESDECTVRLRSRNKRLSLDVGRTNNARFKRLSLQEIEEVGLVCRGIEDTLGVLQQQQHGEEEEKVDKEQCREKVNQTKKLIRKKDIKPNSHPLTTPITLLISHLTLHPLSRIYSNSSHAKHLTSQLCPALYSLFSDGLAPWIETLFGRVANTVWRVVEGSVGGAPTTQILSELVLRINSESELMGEDGPLKFNAFVMGLLNLGTLPSYLDLLRTKDRLLRTHYTPSAYLYAINSHPGKLSFDALIASTKSLNRLRYELDIFYETKLLHCRLSNNNKMVMMKRSWSDELGGVRNKNCGGGKNVSKSKTLVNLSQGQGKFKKLQLAWELKSQDQGGEACTSPCSTGSGGGGSGSRIPRLIGRPGSAYK